MLWQNTRQPLKILDKKFFWVVIFFCFSVAICPDLTGRGFYIRATGSPYAYILLWQKKKAEAHRHDRTGTS